MNNIREGQRTRKKRGGARTRRCWEGDVLA